MALEIDTLEIDTLEIDTLEINIGEEYNIKIEKGNKFDKSIF